MDSGFWIAFDFEAPRPPKGGDESAHNFEYNFFKIMSKITNKIEGKTTDKIEDKIAGTLVSPFRGFKVEGNPESFLKVKPIINLHHQRSILNHNIICTVIFSID